MPSQSASWAAATPGAQESCSAPPEQLTVPVAAQAPCPHWEVWGSQSSSVAPSQSSSTPSQVASLVAPPPAAQVSTTSPPTQTASPTARHAPAPQLVGAAT